MNKLKSVFKKKREQEVLFVSKDFYDPSSKATSSSNSPPVVPRESKVFNHSTWFENPQSIGMQGWPSRAPPDPPAQATQASGEAGMFGYYAPLASTNTEPRMTAQRPPAELGPERQTVTGHIINMPEYIPYQPAADDRVRAEENARQERAAAQENIRRDRLADEQAQARRERAAEEERAQQQDRLAAQRRAKQRNLEAAEEKEKQERLAAEEVLIFRKQNASVKNVRHVRDLIREKYRLDIEVWRRKRVQVDARFKIEEDARKADAILEEIVSIVSDWDNDVFDTPEEWEMAEEIKNGIPKLDEPYVLWRTSPPWDPSRLERSSQIAHADGQYNSVN
ncbi:hypothetical protein LTR78_001532 [Recurvomyces mirabilis]|uniref:Uncharacterized protein n=1 Tax=Recurvomyces mirabilis TaxID=574656 RepID=A0AAE1C5Q4_9PEZI|nr:hypothetical protein LTR78_001532 [Recurvomyces mirabilis]KAK5161510.1 hypothetical protein LTS14_001306 [Recurvomyces mirabilis]